MASIGFLLRATLLLFIDGMIAPAQGSHVFIHHMAGTTFSYREGDWERDMIQAQNAGVEAFALNMGPDAWERERVRDAYRVAETYPSVSGFKLFISFAMPHFERRYSGIILRTTLKAYIDEFANKSSHFAYNGRPVISTFSGHLADFGLEDNNAGWRWLKENVMIPKIFIILCFFIAPSRIDDYPDVDGLFKWHAWQYGSRGDRNLTGRTDRDWQSALQEAGGKAFMASVSPCFYTHFPRNSWDKNWYLGGDDHLLVRRFEELMGLPSPPEFVQILTFNDYGESHYMNNPTGKRMHSDITWARGFDHSSFLRLSSIYIHALKNGGNFPKIERDQIFYWYRTHPSDATAIGDAVGRPLHADRAVDSIYAVALMKASGMVHINNSGYIASRPVPAGITWLEVTNFVPGSVSVSLEREGVTLLRGQGRNIVGRPVLYNFNYFVDEIAEPLEPSPTPAPR